MKRILTLFVSLLLLAVPLRVMAYIAGDHIEYENIVYQIMAMPSSTEDRIQVMLIDASKVTETEVTIPGYFDDAAGDGHFIVTQLGYGSYDNQWPSSVTSIILPETLTALEWKALNGASLTSIEIPKNVKVISINSFPSTLEEITVVEDNPYWKSIDGILYTKDGKTLQRVPTYHPFTDGVFSIPDGVEQLSDQNALNGNLNVSKIIVPASMKTLLSTIANRYSIIGCDNLTELEVNSNNPYLYNDENGVVYKKGTGENNDILHFYPMGKPNEIFTVPDNVTALGPGSCHNAQFKTLDLKNVTELGEKALEGCNKLENVTIPAGLTDIPEGAIIGRNLKNIYVNADNQVYTDIDGVMFSKDKETLVQFPTGRTNKADNPYVVPSTTRVIGANSFHTARISYITIPENTVTTINDDAFKNASLQRLTIPEGVTYVGRGAFQDMYSTLTSVKLPSTLKTLPTYCFRNCQKLSQVEFSEGLEVMGHQAFGICGLTEVTLPKSVEELNSECFQNNPNLTTFIVPEGSELTSLPFHLFWNCPKLETVIFEGDSKIETIGQGVFTNLESLKYIKIPASVTRIQANAFAYTPNLATIVFEEGSQLKTIDTGAFADCGVKSIEIPDNVLEEVNLSVKVNNISPEAFKYCTKLKAINVDKDNQKYSSCDGVLLSKDKTILRLFPAGKANSNFTLLPPSITSIGDYAFYYCENLENVTIPNKVTSIGIRSFGFCKNLNTVTFLCDNMINPNNIAQSIGNASFDDGETNNDHKDYRENITINVRKEMLEQYQNNEYYQKFGDIKPSFIDETTRVGGLNKTKAKEEFIAVSQNTMDLLSVATDDETYVLPTTVENEGKEYQVGLVGDYLFTASGSQVSNVKEVVVPGNVQYIGARAFLTDAALASRNSSVESVFLIGDELNEDLLSTARFELTPEDLGSSKKYYDEFGTDTKIYVRKSAEDTYKRAWSNYTDNISYKIPYTQNGTYGTFAREFDVDFSEVNGVNSEKPVTDDPVLIAFTGTGKYVKKEDTYSVLMTSINLGDQEGKDGTYVPAGSGVLMKKYKEPEGEEGLYYQIAETGISDAFVEGNFMKGITVRGEKIEKNNGYNRYYISGGKLHEMTQSKDFLNHKAFLEIATSDIPAGAKVMLSFTDVNGETTGIESIVENVIGNDNLYNLQGQRVNNATKGIYIKNGKKILVK